MCSKNVVNNWVQILYNWKSKNWICSHAGMAFHHPFLELLNEIKMYVLTVKHFVIFSCLREYCILWIPFSWGNSKNIVSSFFAVETMCSSFRSLDLFLQFSSLENYSMCNFELHSFLFKFPFTFLKNEM